MIREKSCCIRDRQTDRAGAQLILINTRCHFIFWSNLNAAGCQRSAIQKQPGCFGGFFYAFKRVTIVYFTCFACSCSGNLIDLFYWRKVLKRGKYSFFSELSLKEWSICSWGRLKVCPVLLEIEKLTCFVRIHLRFLLKHNMLRLCLFLLFGICATKSLYIIFGCKCNRNVCILDSLGLISALEVFLLM